MRLSDSDLKDLLDSELRAMLNNAARLIEDEELHYPWGTVELKPMNGAAFSEAQLEVLASHLRFRASRLDTP